MGALQDHLGVDLRSPQGGRGVGGEVRVAGAAGQDDHPALLEVADGPPTDVGLGHLGHLDGGLDPGVLVEALEGVLEGQAVDDGAEHAHRVRLRPVHADGGAGGTAPDVATADDDGDVDAELAPDVDDLRGDAGDDVTIDRVPASVGEGLPDSFSTTRFQRDGIPARRRHRRSRGSGPDLDLAKRTTEAEPRNWAMVCFSSLG